MGRLPLQSNRKENDKMGYSVRIKHRDGTDVLLPEKHNIAGGTYAVGGTRDARLYVTYNYAGTFQRVIGGEGLRSLNGGSVKDSLAILVKAIDAIGDEQPDEDYWKPTDGNAKKALVDLKALANLALTAFPGECLTWEVED